MVDRLEIWQSGVLVDTVILDAAEMTIGRSDANDVRVNDAKASRAHALLKRTGRAGWRITDLDSSNGTRVNGQPVRADRPLRHRDRIAIGDTELVLEGTTTPANDKRTVVDQSAKAPETVTRRERDVLTALCRPILAGGELRVPATTHEIAHALVVTDSAVRHHLDRLYIKFDIFDDDPDRRRQQLAVEAIRRGVITTT
jgi:pSer/pThr/pTyr-binding forkhead associated (FHA) protein